MCWAPGRNPAGATGLVCQMQRPKHKSGPDHPFVTLLALPGPSADAFGMSRPVRKKSADRGLPRRRQDAPGRPSNRSITARNAALGDDAPVGGHPVGGPARQAGVVAHIDAVQAEPGTIRSPFVIVGQAPVVVADDRNPLIDGALQIIKVVEEVGAASQAVLPWLTVIGADPVFHDPYR